MWFQYGIPHLKLLLDYYNWRLVSEHNIFIKFTTHIFMYKNFNEEKFV